jgi:hypothetical protein
MSIDTDADLEAVLRATLSRQAETVDRGPDWVAHAALARPRWSRRGWLAPLAAAAAVAAVVGVVIAVEQRPHHVVPVAPPTG